MRRSRQATVLRAIKRSLRLEKGISQDLRFLIS
jgi:hypothetical protein